MKTIDEQVTELGKELDPKPEVSNLVEARITRRPWGTFEILYEDSLCKIKKITVSPGQAISLQSHSKRDETWKLLKGKGEVMLDGVTLEANIDSVAYSYFIIRRGTHHRIANFEFEDLVFIEIQTGESFDESDIIRYADDYGRV